LAIVFAFAGDSTITRGLAMGVTRYVMAGGLVKAGRFVSVRPWSVGGSVP
jgi:hypothetical protein